MRIKWCTVTVIITTEKIIDCRFQDVLGDLVDFTYRRLAFNIFTPACLPRPGNDKRYNEKVATAAGWGRLSKFGNRPSEPHEIDLLVKNNCPAAITYPSIMCYLGKGVVWQGKGGCNVSIKNKLPMFADKYKGKVAQSFLILKLNPVDQID